MGWNWGSPGAKLDKALNVNVYHSLPLAMGSSSSSVFDIDLKDSLRAFQPVPNIADSRAKNVILNAMSLPYNGGTESRLRYLDYDANDALRSGHDSVKNRTNDLILD